jgi:nucleotide-binding universal stress UspA family protein
VRLRESTEALDGAERMEPWRASRSVGDNAPTAKEHPVSTILIGVDDTERSADAIAFGGRLAEATGAHAVIAHAYAYSDAHGRANPAHRNELREQALAIVREQRARLAKLPDDRVTIRITADPSPAKALHHLAHAEKAALLVVGSSHTGRAGRVLPGSTGERLMHGAPCSIAVVPTDHRGHANEPIERIGVAYNDSEESRAAVSAAAALARAFGAELEVISIVSPESYTTPMMVGVAVEDLRPEIERQVQETLDKVIAELPEGITARGIRMTGDAEELLAAQSEKLDLLVMGSRGYGPLRAVLVGGLSGRMLREAQCPVIVVPRGIEAPLDTLFDAAATTTA